MKSFCQIHNFNSLLEKATRYKIPPIPRVSIWSWQIMPAKLFHVRNWTLPLSQMTLKVLNLSFAKQNLRVINYITTNFSATLLKYY